MAVDIGIFLSAWAPILNLLLVVIVVTLFIRLFMRKADEHVYTTPWKLLFVGILIFIVEEGMTVLSTPVLKDGVMVGRSIGSWTYSHLLINGFFEIGIITTFIYMLLLQREHVAKEIQSKRF